jgi:SAM-dependent methyltransferase
VTETSRHDAWQAGEAYDFYMGRWSRKIAPRFLNWLDAIQGLGWLEVGCGTGALSASILAQCNPSTLVAIDPSDGFIATARSNITDERARFALGDAQDLHFATASRDVVVSGLVLNFVSDRQKALTEMKRVARSGGLIGFYVWDYAGGGVEFMRLFWDAAVSIDPAAVELTESRRFPFCTSEGLIDLAMQAGLAEVACTALEVPTLFTDFDDYWHPFTLGTGPAPGYCKSLDPALRQRLKETLNEMLPHTDAGSIPLKARAWAVKARNV